MSDKKKIFITGATGSMGQAALNHLVHKLDSLHITVLVLPTHRERMIIDPYCKMGIEVFWGNIADSSDHSLAQAIGKADMVIHLAAVIPPLSDYHPDLTEKVNVDGTRNVIKAITIITGTKAR